MTSLSIERDDDATAALAARMTAVDCGDFVNVLVDGDQHGPCFTFSREHREWGAAPSDSADTWGALRAKLGRTEPTEWDEPLIHALEQAIEGFVTPSSPIHTSTVARMTDSELAERLGGPVTDAEVARLRVLLSARGITDLSTVSEAQWEEIGRAVIAVIPQDRVTADPATGEWTSRPEQVGTVSAAAWAQREDTGAVHYDTYEADGQTRAVEVHWTAEPVWITDDADDLLRIRIDRTHPSSRVDVEYDGEPRSVPFQAADMPMDDRRAWAKVNDYLDPQ